MSIFIWQTNFMAKFNFATKTFQQFSGVFFLLLVGQFTTLLHAQVWQPGSGVMDIDGNQYPTLLYGNGQEWMGENLRTTKYTDGTPITYITTDADWMAQSVLMYQVTPAFCWYDNDTLNKPIYGGLYSWYVTDPGSNGGKTVCPSGWHVPHSTEWNSLIDYLIVNGMTYDSTTNANPYINKLGKAMADTAYWVQDTFWSDVPGNESFLNNRSGFTGRPAGTRGWSDGICTGIGYYGTWWDSDTNYVPNMPTTTYRMLIYSGQADARHFSKFWANKMTGSPIRCVKDSATTGMQGSIQNHFRVKYYPNPFSTQIQITDPDATTGFYISLLSANGKEILNVKSESSSYLLNTTDLLQGAYLVVVKGKTTEFFKIVKE